MMGCIRAFLQLSSGERGLLIKAVTLVAVLRAGRWLVPFQVLRRAVERLTQKPRRFSGVLACSLEQIGWSVSAAGQCVPASNSLTEALATLLLLHHCGYPADFRVTVSRAADGELLAHAWVESEGLVVIGESKADLEPCGPIPALESIGT